MTKADLVHKVSRRTKLKTKEAMNVVHTVLSSITESLSEGKRVDLRGFGSFSIRHRNARVGLNPKTGQRVAVPSKKVPYFRAGKALRAMVDEKSRESANELNFNNNFSQAPIPAKY